MPIGGIALGTGLGGGTAATISGSPGGGGAAPFANALSLDFDGADGTVLLGSPSELSFSGNFTVSFWMKPAAIGSPKFLIAKRDWTTAANNYQIAMANTGAINLYLSASLTSSTILSAGNWYHILTVVRPGGTSEVWIDGSQDVTGSAGTIADTTVDLAFGSWDNGGYYYEGFLDEISMYDSALSAGNIATIYNGGTPADLSGLSPVGWWRHVCSLERQRIGRESRHYDEHACRRHRRRRALIT